MLKFKKLDERAQLPQRSTEGSAGYDLRIIEDVTLYGVNPYEPVGTGVAVAIPEGHVGLIYPRSGLSTKKGVTLKNVVGVIDSDYRGEIKLALQCPNSYAPLTLKAGERVAQLVITPIATLEPEWVDELPETARADGGFGSTGTDRLIIKEIA